MKEVHKYRGLRERHPTLRCRFGLHDDRATLNMKPNGDTTRKDACIRCGKPSRQDVLYFDKWEIVQER